MNGATALLQTLAGAGVNVCFANPGTSEMHFVAAADDPTADMRTVLGLFEGVATGAADGYARMADRPAATLLHLGPGLANGLANLHNARRARVPIVNIVGDHATYHKQYDPPLESDIDAAASMVSGWIRRATSANELGEATAAAVAAAIGPPARIATLIVPADASWGGGAKVAEVAAPPARTVDDEAVAAVVGALASSQPCLLLLGGRATREEPLREAGRIAAATGATVLTETSPPRVTRGAGIPPAGRLSYRAEAAVRELARFRHVVLVDAAPPVSFFAYPGQESSLLPAGCTVHRLCDSDGDAYGALAAVAEAVAGDARPLLSPSSRPEPPSGALNPASAARALGARLPEGAIVVDESNTSGLFAEAETAGAPPHDWLRLTGGAIGIGLPLALGAAIAAPDRRVITLQADGSALYTIQALWTMGREQVDVTTLLFNNRSYAILGMEMKRLGVPAGPKALSLIDLSRPDIDFVSAAAAFGVEGTRVTTAEDLDRELTAAIGQRGPRLIEVVL